MCAFDELLSKGEVDLIRAINDNTWRLNQPINYNESKFKDGIFNFEGIDFWNEDVKLYYKNSFDK